MVLNYCISYVSVVNPIHSRLAQSQHNAQAFAAICVVKTTNKSKAPAALTTTHHTETWQLPGTETCAASESPSAYSCTGRTRTRKGSLLCVFCRVVAYLSCPA